MNLSAGELFKRKVVVWFLTLIGGFSIIGVIISSYMAYAYLFTPEGRALGEMHIGLLSALATVVFLVLVVFCFKVRNNSKYSVIRDKHYYE